MTTWKFMFIFIWMSHFTTQIPIHGHPLPISNVYVHSSQYQSSSVIIFFCLKEIREILGFLADFILGKNLCVQMYSADFHIKYYAIVMLGEKKKHLLLHFLRLFLCKYLPRCNVGGDDKKRYLISFFYCHRLTKPATFADCVGNELPVGWEEGYDPLIGVYYIDHINRKFHF